MPNGRSGGFPIDTADLKRLVSEVAGAASIGMLTAGSASPALRPAVGAEVLRLVEECPHERLAVEEQDHSSYIIHLSNEHPLVWVWVSSDSPIFAALRQRHGQWEGAHPNWDGWIGF